MEKSEFGAWCYCTSSSTMILTGILWYLSDIVDTSQCEIGSVFVWMISRSAQTHSRILKDRILKM